MYKYKIFDVVCATSETDGSALSGLVVGMSESHGSKTYEVASLPRGDKIFIKESNIDHAKSKFISSANSQSDDVPSENHQDALISKLESYIDSIKYRRTGLVGLMSKKKLVVDPNVTTIEKVINNIIRNLKEIAPEKKLLAHETTQLLDNAVRLVDDIESSSGRLYMSGPLHIIYAQEIKYSLDKKLAIANTSASRIQRSIRESRGRSSYDFMTGFGYIWNNETLNRRFFDGAHGLEYIKQLSKANVRTLKDELIRTSKQQVTNDGNPHTTRFKQSLSPYESEFLTKFLESNFAISHYTDQPDVIKSSGKILSKVQLKAILPPGFKNNTPEADMKTLGNHDMVFFRFEAGDHVVTGTRYGDHGFIYDINDTSLMQNGWVSLQDQLEPYFLANVDGHDVQRDIVWRHRVLRTSKRWDPDVHGTAPGPNIDYTGRFQYGIWKVYPLSNQTVLHNTLEEIFYGPDILWGIGLSMIREMRRLNCQPYIEEILGKMTPDRIGLLLSRIFRVEAKIPKAFYIKNEERIQSSSPQKSAPKYSQYLRTAEGNSRLNEVGTAKTLYSDQHHLPLEKMRSITHYDVETQLRRLSVSEPHVQVSPSLEIDLNNSARTQGLLKGILNNRTPGVYRMLIPVYFLSPSQLAGLYIRFGSNTSATNVFFIDPAKAWDLSSRTPHLYQWILSGADGLLGTVNYSNIKTGFHDVSKRQDYTYGWAVMCTLMYCLKHDAAPQRDGDGSIELKDILDLMKES
jgi:hypothetical protein